MLPTPDRYSLHCQQHPPKMILSTRKAPPKRLDLPRGAPKKSRVRQLLLSSPLPSPSLPSILPRHGKKPPRLKSRRLLQFLGLLSIFVLAGRLLSYRWRPARALGLSQYQSPDGRSYQIVGEDELPNYATPVAVTDSHGKARWTVSIPAALDFPLRPVDYLDICTQADEVSQHVSGPTVGSQSFNRRDPHYIDVDEAQSQNLLPRHLNHRSTNAEISVCSSSLTFVFDATSAPLGVALMHLWLAYSLAKVEGRAFFIDDSRFPYGNYHDFVKSIPNPKCALPSPTQRVPCPRQAKHLVVSPGTSQWVFGSDFESHFGQRRIFDMARAGYDALFKVHRDDEQPLASRLSELSAAKSLSSPDSLQIGIHIRHGDHHPVEFQYSQSYIPLTKYLEAAQSFLTNPATIDTENIGSESNSDSSSSNNHNSNNNNNILIASDDPDVYNSPYLAGLATRAQSHISLASKNTMPQHHGDGWEGGWFHDVFWGLGLSADARRNQHADSPQPSRKKKPASPPPPPLTHNKEERLLMMSSSSSSSAVPVPDDPYLHPTADALQLRALIARAYLLDVAVLGRSSERLVCGAASHTCRLLAVVMGWERAVEHAHWRSVDGGVATWRAVG